MSRSTLRHIPSSHLASFPIFETRDIDISTAMRWETTIQYAMQPILFFFKPNNLNVKNL